jgi:hypothetical protein
MKNQQFVNKVQSVPSLLILLVGCHLMGSVLFSQNIGINNSGAIPNSKALLDIDADGTSNKGGLLVPRLTDSERAKISEPIPESMMIFNTSEQCFQAWNAPTSSWVSFWYTGCKTTPTPIALNATAVTNNSFTANWSAVPGETNYYLDVSTNSSFSTFVPGYQNLPVGSNLNYVINNNISCYKTYYYRIRSNIYCNILKSSNTITVTTTGNSNCFTCGQSMAVQHVSGTISPETKLITYGTVLANLTGSSKCWATQNLGASGPPNSSTDNSQNSEGWYWQFGTRQGYKKNTTEPFITPNFPPGNINDVIYDWQAYYDPCTNLLGSGWRIPTLNEWIYYRMFHVNSIEAAFNSVLKLHETGVVNCAGNYSKPPNSLFLWSSTNKPSQPGESIGYGYCLGIYPYPNPNQNNTVQSISKCNGLQIRCIGD